MKFDAVSKTLQSQAVDISVVKNLYDSLVLYISSFGSDEEYDKLETDAKLITKCEIYESDVKRTKIRKRVADESRD